MHPIEHLRYVARARGADATSLARETAVALGSLRADQSNLVIACRRIIERHPGAGPVWWLCSRLLTAEDPAASAWELADLLDDDPAHRSIAAGLPDGATVVTIGWPETGGSALMRRGDVRVLCADSRHEASSFMQRLERLDVACDPVPSESLARVVAAADIAIVDASVACPERVLSPVGSHVLAAVARSVGTPLWLTVGIGRRLPVEYVDAIAGRVLCGPDADPRDDDLDDLPLDLVTHVVSSEGVSSHTAVALRPDCPCTPELLRGL